MLINPISYPGNKIKILNELLPQLVTEVEIIIDVFGGSGVVGVNSCYKNIIINDISKEAIELLKYFYENSSSSIIDEVEKNINRYGLTYSRIKPKNYYYVEKFEGLSKHNRKGFMKLRDDYNIKKTPSKLFVLLIYGFNHYFRFNSRGEFNVPVGKVDFSESIYKKTEKFIDGIKKKNISFFTKDFRDKSLYKYDNAIYYFDPPYIITSAPYNANWTIEDELDLLNILDSLNKQGKKFVLSNVFLSNGKVHDLLKKWSKKYNVLPVGRQYRNANYRKKNLTNTEEVIIKNFT